MRKLSVVILLARTIPAIAFLIPWYMIVSALRLTDTYIAVAMSHMVISMPFCIWVLTPFCENIPFVIEEAAIIDGCSPFRRFIAVILPLSSAGIITVLIMSFIFSWNNFMFAMTLSGANTRTLPPALFNFLGYSFVDWGALMAAAVIIVFPVLFIAFLTQRYIIRGLTAGAVKG
jgi:multiple sugar transport system permease protein